MTDHARGCEGRAYTCTCGYDDAKDQRIAELEAENERMREALTQIASPDYGYADIIESGLPPEKHTDYFCSMVAWRQRTARAALGDKQ